MTQSTCPFGTGSDPQGGPRLPRRYDFTDPDVLLQGIPVTEFAELRKTAPVWWNDQIPNIAKLDEPQRLRSGWINGVKALPVSYRD